MPADFLILRLDCGEAFRHDPSAGPARRDITMVTGSFWKGWDDIFAVGYSVESKIVHDDDGGVRKIHFIHFVASFIHSYFHVSPFATISDVDTIT